MSRIGDDNSDNQRIREMQEAELRNRTDREKADREKVTRSFQDVMRDRTAKTSAAVQQSARQQQKGQNQKKPGGADGKEPSLAESVLRRHVPKTGAELARRAALSRAMEGSLQKTRSTDAERARASETERNDDLVKRSDDERERIDRDVRESDAKDTVRAEEAEAQFRKVDPDGERKGRSSEQRDPKGGKGESDGRDRSERVTGAEGPKGAAGARTIPPEVIEALVNGIQSGLAADGRTELHIDLKGDLLEGVRLKVKSENGKVHCTFVGCDKELKNLLESSKGALMRGLSRRGMTLASLKVS